MLNNIFLKFSEFAMLNKEEHPFSDKYGAVLTDYLSTEDIVDASVDDLVAFISSKSRGRISDPEQTTYLLQKAAQDSYRLDKCLYEPLTVSIGCSFNCKARTHQHKRALALTSRKLIHIPKADSPLSKNKELPARIPAVNNSLISAFACVKSRVERIEVPAVQPILHYAQGFTETGGLK